LACAGAPGDHCNAEPTVAWVALRKARQAAAAPPAPPPRPYAAPPPPPLHQRFGFGGGYVPPKPPPPPPTAPPGALQPGHVHTPPKDDAPLPVRAPRAHARSVAAAKASPHARSRCLCFGARIAKQHTNCAQDPTTFGATLVELGELRLPVRSAPGVSLSSVDARLARSGFVPHHTDPNLASYPHLAAAAALAAAKAGGAAPPPLSLVNLFQSAPVPPNPRSTQRFVHTDSADEADDDDSDAEEMTYTARHRALYGGPSKATPEFLALRRLVRPGAPPRAASVPCHVTFVRADGAAPPVTHALPLPRGATAGAVLAAATAAAALPPGGRLVLLRGRTEGRGLTLRWRELRFVNGAHIPEEPVHCHNVRHGIAAMHRRIKPVSDANTPLSLCLPACAQWRIYGDSPDEQERRVKQASQRPRFLAYCMPPAADEDASGAGAAGGAGGAGGADDDADDDHDDDDEKEDAGAAAGAAAPPAKKLEHAAAPTFVPVFVRHCFTRPTHYGVDVKVREVIGFPLLLPLPPSGPHGGDASVAELQEALRVAMAPLLKPGAAWTPPDALTRCCADGSFRAAAYAGGGAPRDPTAMRHKALMRQFMLHHACVALRPALRCMPPMLALHCHTQMLTRHVHAARFCCAQDFW
jgi:hypothetical protein